MVTARRIGKIDVWPDYTTARAADTEASGVVGRLTVWRSNELAQENIEYPLEGGSDNILQLNGINLQLNGEDLTLGA